MPKFGTKLQDTLEI